MGRKIVMNYTKPTMELFELEKDIVCSSDNELDPNNPYPGEGEDGEEYL